MIRLKAWRNSALLCRVSKEEGAIQAKVFMLKLVILYCFCALLSLPASAQTSNTVTELVVIADGSKNPELIPDALAWRHFLTAIATHEQPTAQEQLRQQAQFAPLALATADAQQIAGLLGKMMTQLEAIEKARENSNGANSTLATLKAQEDAAIASTTAAVQAAVSSDGLSRLSGYIGKTVKVAPRSSGAILTISQDRKIQRDWRGRAAGIG
jgi:hypothetical protein